MQFSSKRLLPSFLSALQSLPGVQTIECQSHIPHDFDELLQLSIGARSLTLCIQEESAVSPAAIRQALDRLERYKLMMAFIDSIEHDQVNGGVSLAFLATAIPQCTQRALRRARITFFDLNGALFLIGHGIYVSVGTEECSDDNRSNPVSCLLQ